MTCVWSKECHCCWGKSPSWSRRMFRECLLSLYCWGARQINQLTVIYCDTL